MSVPEVVIIDYGVGNLLSVRRGFEYCGANVTLTADPEIIFSARRVVLPGVGAFHNAMKALNELGLISVIHDLALREIPLLGICLGMQLLLDESEEFGVTEGLGLIAGRVVTVPNQTLTGELQKIPHIGWNGLRRTNVFAESKNTLMRDIADGESTYFVHSFMAVTKDPSHRIAECLYGGHKIAAMIGKNNITGCQFHPEKSGDVGLKVLRNFLSQ